MATVWFGEAPVSQAACAEAEKLSPGHCDLFHATDEAYFKDVYYWNTPTRRVPRRSRRDLQGLLRMDEGLDRDQGLTPETLVTTPAPVWEPGSLDRTTDPHDHDLGRDPGAGAARPAGAAVRRRRLAAALYRRPRPSSALLLAAPLGWLLIAYIGSLVVLFISAFWHLDPFSGDIVTEPIAPELRGAALDPDLPDGRDPDDRVRGARHGHGHHPGVPDRLLHGARGRAPDAGAARRLDPAAAVVGLPRQGLRLAPDPRRGRGCSTGCSSRSG